MKTRRQLQEENDRMRREVLHVTTALRTMSNMWYPRVIRRNFRKFLIRLAYDLDKAIR